MSVRTSTINQASTINDPVRQRARRRRNWTNRAWVLAFILPALIIYGTYNVYGIIMTFYYSTLNWGGMGPVENATSVGLQNYIDLLSDRRFLHALSNNLLLVFVSVTVQLSFGLILAMIIQAKIRGSKLFRTVYFMPMLLSTAATSIMWILLMSPRNGAINVFLRDTIGIANPPAWLGNESTVMFALLFVICWQFTPMYMILLRAGMTGIPEELYEAAAIDGADKWHQFWKVTLPLLSGTLRTSAVLSIIGSLMYFDLVWIMTGGGPNGHSELMATYMFRRAFNEESMGYASAVAGSMFIISLVVVMIFLRMTRSRSEAK